MTFPRYQLHSTDREAQEAEMTVDKNRFTKLERKELRRLAGLAYERELAKALEAIEEKFRQWKKNRITAFELSDHIHEFHNGISRDLWSFYTTGHVELSVKHAIAEGIILETEISSGILEKLNITLSERCRMKLKEKSNER
ncbi:MAG: hypothetical protein WAW67_07695 [Candidatus Omnitrophota bacterium]